MDSPPPEFVAAYNAAGLTGWGPWSGCCPYCRRPICRHPHSGRFALHNICSPTEGLRRPSLVGWRCPASGLTSEEAVSRLR